MVPCSCDVLPLVPVFSWVCSQYPAPLLAPLPRAFPLTSAFPAPRWLGGWLGLEDADGPCLRMESPVEGFGGVEGAEALNRVPEERFPCR